MVSTIQVDKDDALTILNPMFENAATCVNNIAEGSSTMDYMNQCNLNNLISTITNILNPAPVYL